MIFERALSSASVSPLVTLSMRCQDDGGRTIEDEQAPPGHRSRNALWLEELQQAGK